MLDPSLFPQAINTILITQLDGLSDIMLGTMLLSGLHRRWPGAYIKMLVRPQMAAVSNILPKWVRVIPLSFDPREPVAGREEMLAEQLRAISEDCQADITLLAEFDRVWASEILANMASSDLIVAFNGPSGMNPANRAVADALEVDMSEPWQRLAVYPHQPEIEKYRAMLEALGLDPGAFLPGGFVLRTQDQNAADKIWADTGLKGTETILLFPGRGPDLSRTLVPAVWSRWAAHLSQRHSVLIVGSEIDKNAIDAIVAGDLPQQVKHIVLSNDQLGTLTALIETASAFIGSDSGPMHIAAALGRPTLGIFGGGDRGQRYLPIGRKAAAARMPISCYGCDWDCPFDSRLCLSHMPIELLLATAEEFVQRYRATNTFHEAAAPDVYDLPAAADLPVMMLGPIMRMHRSMHQFQKEVRDHQDFMARVNADRQGRVSEMGDALSSITNILSEMARQNRTRDETINQLKTAMSIFAQQNSAVQRTPRGT